MNTHRLTGLAAGLIIGAAIALGISVAVGNKEPAQINTKDIVSTIDHNTQATAKLKDLKGDDFDKAFVEEMILHHQGAIDMAKLIDTNAKHDELKQLGREIISAQSKEIDIMQAWQTEWGYGSVPQSHDEHDM
jgi:uncharacterized protein (DUF305 family)